MLETERFIVRETEPLYAERGGIRADRMERLQVVGFAALTVECKHCGEVSRVTAFTPELAAVAGGVIVTCPDCGNEEAFNGRALNSVNAAE